MSLLCAKVMPDNVIYAHEPNFLERKFFILIQERLMGLLKLVAFKRVYLLPQTSLLCLEAEDSSGS